MVVRVIYWFVFYWMLCMFFVILVGNDLVVVFFFWEWLGERKVVFFCLIVIWGDEGWCLVFKKEGLGC